MSRRTEPAWSFFTAFFRWLRESDSFASNLVFVVLAVIVGLVTIGAVGALIYLVLGGSVADAAALWGG